MDRTRGALTTHSSRCANSAELDAGNTFRVHPSGIKPATHGQARPLSGFTAATPGMKTLLSPESKSFKTPSPPPWLPLPAAASVSPLQTSRRANVISTAGSRPVPVRRHPLCAHIPRSAAQPVGPLSPQTGLNCDSNAGGFRSPERGLPSLL